MLVWHMTLIGTAVGVILGLGLQRRWYVHSPVPALGCRAIAWASGVGAGLFTLLGLGQLHGTALWLGCVFAAGGVAASWMDLDAHLIPDRLTMPLALMLAGIVLADAVASGEWGRAWVAFGGAAVVTALFLLWAVFASLGLGDVKFGASLGLMLGYLGWGMLLRGVLFGLLIGALCATWMLLRGHARTTYLPFGPALVLGAVAALSGGVM